MQGLNMSYVENVEEFLRAIKAFTTAIPDDHYNKLYSEISGKLPLYLEREIRFTHPGLRDTHKRLWEDRVYFIPGEDQDFYENTRHKKRNFVFVWERDEKVLAGVTYIPIELIPIDHRYRGINQRVEDMRLDNNTDTDTLRFLNWLKERGINYIDEELYRKRVGLP